MNRLNTKETLEQSVTGGDSVKRFAFIFGRGIAFLYRLNTLRLAGTVFRGVNSSTVLRRRYFGKSLVLDVSRSSAQRLLWLQGERFVQERSLFSQLVRPGMVFVDVGANIGYYALMFASLLRGEGEILCLEPDPTNLLELKANVAENKLERMISVLPIAAGDEDGTMRFEPGLNAHATPTGTMEVIVKKLDSLAPAKVDFIKIDVEGYEGAVLDGARETIERFRPTIFLELHPRLLTRHTHKGIIQFIKQRYSKVSAYQISRGNLLRRALQNYGLVDQLNEIGDIRQMAEAYEDRRYPDPCWLVGQP